MGLFGRGKTENNSGDVPYGQGSPSPIGLVNCDLRDGQQSLLATRISTAEFLPILDKMDQVGYHEVECWGGATFDCCIRYVGDDPWERLRQFKAAFKKTPLRMLLRGQNLIGYQQYPDDVVEKFVELAAKNGIDRFEVFDGLNDPRNAETAIRAIKKNGKKVEGLLTVCTSPVHTIEKYIECAQQYIAYGADEIYVEDMAGMLTPNQVFRLVSEMRKAVKVPVRFHGHSAGGMMDIEYWEAIRAGAASVDVVTSALSRGTSLPAVETFALALQGTRYDPHLDLKLLGEINDYFMQIRKNHADTLSGFVGVDVGIAQHQVPGGMMSNLESQLRQMNAYERLPEILEEIHRVREDLGFPPLATPFAQIVGSQATFNVLTGERYKVMSKEIRDYVQGRYGRAPGEIAQSLKDKVDMTDAITVRPGSLLEPGWEKGRAEAFAKGLARTDEDAMTYILFPAVAEPFLQKKYGIQ